MTERFPYERNLLRGLTPEKYERKMEHIIVAEGKRLLDSLGIRYRIVSEKHVTAFVDKHLDFKEDFNKRTIWHQIRIEYLYDTHEINTYQYQLLSMMRQVLNKNGDYILRKDEFKNREYVMRCEWYPKSKECFRHSCVANQECPHYYKNTNKHERYKKLAEEYQKKKEEKLQMKAEGKG